MKGQFDSKFFRFSLFFLLFFLCLVFDVKGQLADSPWPVECHDGRRSGQSQFNGVHFNNLKWSFHAYGDVSSVVTGLDGTIYFGSADKNLYALNPDGILKWKFTTGGTVSSPAINSDGTIYIGSEDDYLYAVNSDGSLKWKFKTGHNVGSPIISSDGSIYVPSSDQYIYAINADGTLKWKFYIYTTWGTNNIAIGPNGTIYESTFSNSYSYDIIYALNPFDGTLKWKHAARGTPAIALDGTIYVGTRGLSDKHLQALDHNGTLKWKYKTKISSPPSIGNDGTIYFGNYGSSGSENGYVKALNPDGTLKWSTPIEGITYSPPAIGSDGTIYAGSTSHGTGGEESFYALNPDGTINWKYKGKFNTSPAISSDGSVYVGSELNIYAFGKSSGPKILVENPNLNFGSVLVGYSRIINLRIINAGDVPLSITNIISNSDNFIALPSSFIVPVDSVMDVGVKFTPTSLNTVNSDIQISCNDPYNPNLNISVLGSGINLNISDLTILNVSTSSILIKWTAPGDASFQNKAKEYDIRYFKRRIDYSNWDLATRVEDSPIPLPASSFQDYRLQNLNSSSKYFIAMKASDDAGNWSDISNVVSATTVDSTEKNAWNMTDVDGGISFELSSLALANNIPHIAYYGGGILYFAKFIGNSWANEIVAFAPNVSSLSLSIDKNDNPYVLYETDNDLKYSFYNGQTWQTESIPLEGISQVSSFLIDSYGHYHLSYYDPNVQDLKYAYYDGSAWNFQTVDSDGNVGQSPSLSLDNLGNPCISYYDATKKDIKYASFNGLSWNISIVDSGNVKPYSFLAIDHYQQRHIIYYTYTETCDWYDSGICINKGPDILNLKYGHYDGTHWTIEDIESTTGENACLLLDNESNPHIVYYEGERVWTDYIPTIGYTNSYIELISTKYAYKTGSYWNKNELFDKYMPGSYALDSDKNLHYCTTFNGSVEYYFREGTAWKGKQMVRPQDIVGRYNSIALDKNGNPHISYYDETNKDLKYAYYNGSSWVIQTVDTTGNTGIYTSLSLDNLTFPHIVYINVKSFISNTPRGNLKYAYFDGNSWNTDIVDSSEIYGCSLSLDNDGLPHIIYTKLEGPPYRIYLKYTYYDGTSWNYNTIDSELVFVSDGSIVVDEMGNPHVGYLQGGGPSFTNKLKYAYFDGSSWYLETIDQGLPDLRSISIALDKNDEPNICYTSTWSKSPENPGYGYYLKNAFRAGERWKKEIIYDKTQGKISMVSDKSGYLHVLFKLYGGGVLYAIRKNQQWRAYELGITAYDYSIAIDETGHPHLSCYYNKGLKYISNPVLTEVEFSHNHNNGLPIAFRLLPNYPNPFNPTTTIRYELPKTSNVGLSIYNLLGQLVKRLVDKNQQAGIYKVVWDSKDNHDRPVSSGIYFCRMQAGDFVKTVKIMLIR